MLAEQGGRCAVCAERPAEHVDHDHVTGKVRGLLCFNCNGGLGQFRDDPQILELAIEYLTPEPGKDGRRAQAERLTRIMTQPPGITRQQEAARTLLLAGPACGRTRSG